MNIIIKVFLNMASSACRIGFLNKYSVHLCFIIVVLKRFLSVSITSHGEVRNCLCASKTVKLIKLARVKFTTPQPLYNTIIGVQTNFRVSYPICIITRVKCIVIQQNESLMTIWGPCAISKTML